MTGELQIPVPKFLFLPVPARQEPPQDTESLHDFQLPVPGHHVPAEPFPEDDELRAGEVSVAEAVAMGLLHAVADPVALAFFRARQKMRDIDLIFDRHHLEGVMDDGLCRFPFPFSAVLGGRRQNEVGIALSQRQSFVPDEVIDPERHIPVQSIVAIERERGFFHEMPEVFRQRPSMGLFQISFLLFEE